MIGRAAGAPIVLAPSWLIAAVVLTVVFAPTVQARAPHLGAVTYVVALLFVVLLFASVLVHEIAHGLVARARGQQVHEFVLTLWGGHTSFGGAAASPATSALVAVVGPLANVLLAGAFWVVGQGVPAASLTGLVLFAGAFANAFVAVFNLIPGLPLDGGRILEAGVWAATGRRHTGTVAAGWVGRAVAVGVLAWAVLLPLVEGYSPDIVTVVWSALIGAFLWSGASAAIRAGHSQRAVGDLTVARVGHPAVGVAVGATLAQASTAAASAGVGEVVVLSPDGRPAAYVDTTAAASVPPDAAGSTPVTAVCVPVPVGAVVDAGLAGEALLDAVAAVARLSPVLVAMHHGRVVALVRTTDVAKAIRS